MAYRPIAIDHIKDPILHEVFEHADIYLRDVYSMLAIDESVTGGGPCNFSIALVLLCVVDGLAREVHPTMRIQDQAKRFCRLIRDKLPWPPNDARWVDVSRSANVMYLELRNPIAHELAQDKITSARPEGYMDPAVVKTRAGRTISVDVIDSLTAWDPSWPILSTAVRSNGRKRYVLDCGALYWAIKTMMTELAMDTQLHTDAIRARQILDAGQGAFHLFRIEEKIARWANIQKEITRVWIYGSRVNGNNDLGAELAIAVELELDEVADEALPAVRARWAGLRKQWHKELASLIRLPIELDEHREGICSVSCGHVGNDSKRAFDRNRVSPMRRQVAGDRSQS